MIVRRNYNYRVVLAVVVTLMLAMIGVVNAETISLNAKAGPCEIIKDRHGYDSVTIDGYKTRGAPGNPMLPSKVFNILVPPDIIWDSLELNIVDVETGILPGTYEIRPAAPDAAYVDGKMVYDWGRSVNVVDGKNVDVYGADAFFPTEYAKLVPYSQMRKWKYTKVYFSPIQYNPVTGKLKLFKNIKIEISFQRSGDRASPALLRDRVMDCLAPELFHNYTQGKGWYVLPDGPEQGGTEVFNDSNSWKDGDLPLKVLDQPSITYDYVIITTNAVVSGSSKLSSFISHKQARGHSVLVVTETDFAGLTGQTPDHRAEKIRQWLINNYLTYGIEYVLLIGDPEPYESAGSGEDIPMKMCWPRQGAGSYEESPTDAFYADLTGDWDLDNDQYYGEWSDYMGSGGVDFAMEVWVGRIPVYSAAYSTLDNILQKIMDYENETTISWRESILLPMSFSTKTYDGAPLAEQMMDDYLTARTYSSWTQYQQGNGACGLNSTYPSNEELRGGTVVRDRWAANDYGVVCWWGHGNSTSASVGCDGCWDGTLFSYNQTSSLDDDHPSFTYQCSCTNAYPESSNNLAYSILKQGGIGTVSATRVSWFNTNVGYGDFDGSSTNSGIGYEYVKRLTQPLAGGRALYEAKLAVVPDIGVNTRLMNQYDFNLYGDPAVGLDSSSSTTVLWNQPASSTNTNTYANQDFETTNDSYDIFIADDFTNTQPWNIQTIFVPGNTWSSGCDLTCATTLNFMIYADNGGVPDGYPDGGLGGGGNSPIWNLAVISTDSQVSLTTGTGGFLTNVTLNLNTPIKLTPRTYWFVFYPEMSFVTCAAQSGRHVSDTTNGYIAQVINPGGGFSFPTSWTAVTDPSTWNLTQQDFAFRLEGTVGGGANMGAIYLLLLGD
jgi:hypothetical protein